MSRGFSLSGAVFAFHCVPQRERRELETLLLRHDASIYAGTSQPDVVHVLTSYWADCEPPQLAAPVRPVTRFWLQETLRLGRWLRPDSHPFFEPPPRPAGLRLQYPRAFQDAAQGQLDGDGDVRMEPPTAAEHRHRMQLPCSPGFLFRDEVPLWPYVAAHLSRPIRDVHELAARLQQITLSDPRRRFNCLEYAVIELLTREERATFFDDVLPEMMRLVLDMPQMFATPPPLLTPLEASEEEEVNAGDDARIKRQTLPSKFSLSSALRAEKQGGAATATTT
ncbi:Poly(ADP-ribose) glycohydrolase [Phytophthora cinnamomi]|uniref:Poly(ADP-ribose) glycohydrolase n=1 Tax=Phytophthora cinnamomi TaxID=4785 RepID=UPI003559FF13|nr:Poly(ADP-ribose) glycohydrolase [Phytophthora cinnamomi]